MRNIIGKIDWKKVAKIGSCVLTGVLACMSAFSEEKQASKIEELESRVASLESK